MNKTINMTAPNPHKRYHVEWVSENRQLVVTNPYFTPSEPGTWRIVDAKTKDWQPVKGSEKVSYELAKAAADVMNAGAEVALSRQAKALNYLQDSLHRALY